MQWEAHHKRMRFNYQVREQIKDEERMHNDDSSCWPGADRPWLLPMVGQAASWPAVGMLRGGKGCHQTLEGAASRVCHAKQQAVKARGQCLAELNTPPLSL